MNCDNCGNTKAISLLTTGKGHLVCDKCLVSKPQGRDAILNRVRFHKYGMVVTEADAMRIKTNRKCPDGEFRPAPRWRTTGD